MREKMIDGIPYFVIADACKLLGISDVNSARERLPEEDTRQTRLLTNGGEQLVWVGNQCAMYDLILRSDKPNARKIQLSRSKRQGGLAGMKITLETRAINCSIRSIAIQLTFLREPFPLPQH